MKKLKDTGGFWEGASRCVRMRLAAEDEIIQEGRPGGFFVRRFKLQPPRRRGVVLLCLVAARPPVNAAPQDDAGIFWDAPGEVCVCSHVL